MSTNVIVCGVAVLLLFSLPPKLAEAQESDTIARASFDELKKQVAGLEGKPSSNEAVSKLIESWVDEQGIDRLDIEQSQWCLEQCLPHATERRYFSVVWTGTITPPRTGKYTFSVSPINVNQPLGQNSVRHTIAVTIGDTRVVDAGPKAVDGPAGARSSRWPADESSAHAWKWKGEPIELEANQLVSIRVEMHYECREPSDTNSPSAIVSWDGPGIGHQPIPTDVLTSPEGAAKCLRAEYTFRHGNGPPRSVIQTSPNVDFAWLTPADVVPANPDLVSRLTNRLWQLATTPDFLAECASGSRLHPYFANSRVTQYLTSAQRREFLELLTDNQPLLSRMEDDQLLALYRALRFGAEDHAIDLLGTWMQLNADVAPKITANFFHENRQAYAELAIHLARQHQDAYRQLQGRYLEMPDGRCALPVVYSLCYSYRMLSADRTAGTDRIPSKSLSSEWTAVIDRRLKDDSIVEDTRINWLIAKAHAQESRNRVNSDAFPLHEDYLAGMGWLIEAQVVVRDNSIRTRIYQEQVARAAASHRDAMARHLLREAADSAPASTVQRWRESCDAIAQLRQQKRLADTQLARAAYVKSIQRRRERAEQQGDDQAVARYDQILEQAVAGSN